MNRCTICNSGWEILENDRFCGWCGSLLIGFQVLLKSPTEELFYSDYDDKYELDFIIENIGIKSLVLHSIEITKSG